MLWKLEEDFEQELKIVKDCEKEWNESKPVNRRIREFKEEMELELGKDKIKEMRLDYLKPLVHKLREKLVKIEKEYLEDASRNIPFFWRRAVYEVKGANRLRSQINKFQGEIYYLENENSFKNKEITFREIEIAKDYPFGNLIETKNNFAICPFHLEKKPSFWIKNNRGHCFGCGADMDTIEFVMRTQSKSFIEAVKFLQV